MVNRNQSRPSLLTVMEVARYLRVHPATIYRLLSKHKVPAFRVGEDWRFSVVEIDRWRLVRERRH